MHQFERYELNHQKVEKMERLIENRGGQYLYIKLSGKLNIHENSRHGFRSLLKILQRNKQLSKVLIDCLDLYGDYLIADRYFVNESLAFMNLNFMKEKVSRY